MAAPVSRRRAGLGYRARCGPPARSDWGAPLRGDEPSQRRCCRPFCLRARELRARPVTVARLRTQRHSSGACCRYPQLSDRSDGVSRQLESEETPALRLPLFLEVGPAVPVACRGLRVAFAQVLPDQIGGKDSSIAVWFDTGFLLLWRSNLTACPALNRVG